MKINTRRNEKDSSTEYLTLEAETEFERKILEAILGYLKFPNIIH